MEHSNYTNVHGAFYDLFNLLGPIKNDSRGITELAESFTDYFNAEVACESVTIDWNSQIEVTLEYWGRFHINRKAA